MSGPPGRYVVLYDGDCDFCKRWRDRMMPRDRDKRIEWLSVHDPSVAERFPALDRDDAMRQMYVYAPDGTVHKGSEGWMELFRFLQGLSWLRALGRIPGMSLVMRRVYRFIAERRYRLSCANAACRLPGRRDAEPKTPRLRLVLIPALLTLAAVGAFVAGCATGPPDDPVMERLQATADDQAAGVLKAMLDAYGGYTAFRSHRNVEYIYRLEFYGGQKTPEKVTRQVHRLGLGRQEQAYLEDLGGSAPQVVRIDGDNFEVTRGGVPVTDLADLDFPRAFGQLARWTFLIPWNLLDPDCRLEYRGMRTPPTQGDVPAGECDVIRLRYYRGAKEGEDTDWYDFYVSRLSRLLDRIHSYRAEDAAYRVSIWSDHVKFADLRVATRRATYASDAGGTLGALELVAGYSDIRFDAPFKDDIYRGSVPLAASSARE